MVNSYIRTLQSDNAPNCVQKYLYKLADEHKLSNPRRSVKLGGLMYDGDYFYPLDNNQVLYYNLFTGMAYILQLKYPADLTNAEVNAIDRLRMEDGDGAKYAGYFMDMYRSGEFGKNNPRKPFPYELLPYLPVGLYKNARSIVVSTTGVYGMKNSATERIFSEPAKGYRYGQGNQTMNEEAIMEEQIRFGIQRNRSIGKSKPRNQRQIDERIAAMVIDELL